MCCKVSVPPEFCLLNVKYVLSLLHSMCFKVSVSVPGPAAVGFLSAISDALCRHLLQCVDSSYRHKLVVLVARFSVMCSVDTSSNVSCLLLLSEHSHKLVVLVSRLVLVSFQMCPEHRCAVVTLGTSSYRNTPTTCCTCGPSRFFAEKL